MQYNSLNIENREGIVILTINRPKALNAINKEVMTELNHFFTTNFDDFSIRGVVITGSGEKAFVAGADIKEFSSLSENETVDKSSFGHETYFKIENFHAPVIAAVNGFALGGGCELAMACHMRIASEKAKFGQPEVNLGLLPGYGATQRLTYLVGKGRAFELLFTAKLISAQRAFEMGLVNEVVEPGESLNRSIEILELIKTKAPIALKETIKVVNAGSNKTAYKEEALAFGRVMITQDAKEGAAAFVQKRKANFQGI